MARRPGEGSNSGPGAGTRTRPAKKRPVTSRPLVLAPRASKPSKRVFGGGVPVLETPGSAKRRQATRTAGRELAKAPGVKARLTPARPASTPAQRRAVQDRARRLSAAAGLSAQDREALATTRTPAGATLRQAGRLQEADALRQVYRSLRAGRPVGQDTVRAGRPDRRIGIGPASINTTALGRTILGATSLEGNSPENRIFKNAARDAGLIATGPFIGGVQVAGALDSLRRGDTQQAGRRAGALADALWEGTKTSVPGYLAQGKFNEALESGRQHPLFALLDLGAAAGIAGRTAGAVSRGAGSTVEASGLRGALARAGSPVRPPIALTSDAAAVRGGAYRSRSYSMDSIRKGVQVAKDRPREVLRDHKGRVVTVVERGRRVPVLKPTASEMARFQKKRANHEASRANAVERLVRAETIAVANEMTRASGVRGKLGQRLGSKLKGPVAQDLPHLVATGVIRGVDTFREDLLKRADTIRAEISKGADGDYRHAGERKAAIETEKRLRKAADDPKVLAQADAIVEVGLEVARRLNEGDAGLIGRQVIDPRQAERARLSEYAFAQMDAKHFTVEEHRALEAAARKKERGLLTMLRAAESPGAPYYRGVRDNGSRTGGNNWWDNHTFISHDETIAKGYAYGPTGRVERLHLRPGARVLHRDTPEYDAFLKKHGLHRDEATKTARLAEREGYDVVDFKQGDLGAIVLNESVLVRGAKTVEEIRAEYRKALQERIAVSGRDPRLVVAHERAQALARVAKREVKEQRDRVERVRREIAAKTRVATSQRAADRQAVLQGRMTMREALVRDAKRGKGGKDADGEIGRLRTLLDREQAKLRGLEKKNRDAQEVARSSKLPPVQAAIRTRDGRLLTDDMIREHAAAADELGRGVRDPSTLAYVPHVAGGIGNRAYHQAFRPGTRPRLGADRRTGAMFQRGANAVGQDVVRDALVSKAVTLTKAQQLDRMISDSGVRHPAVAKAQEGGRLSRHEQRIVDRGGYFTAKEADELAKRLEGEGRGEYVAVRAHSAKMTADEIDAVQGVQGPAAMETAHLSMFNDRVVSEGLGKADASRARNVVLMPVEEWNRLVAHAAPAGELEKVAQAMNAPFRMAVLPQTRWLFGNVVEPFFVRLPLSGAGINLPGAAMDFMAARKVLKTMERSGDPALMQAAREISAQQLGGLFIGNRGASVRRTSEDFAGRQGREGATRRERADLLMADPAAAAAFGAHVVRHLPVVKQVLDLAVGLAHGFFGVNRVIERFMQMQGLGKSIRQDVHAFTGSWFDTVRLGEKAAQEAAQGLVNTATQQRYMEAQHQLLGKYEGFDPLRRRMIQTVTPFLPWTMAAARFVFWTMPAHHTVATAALLKLSQDVQKDWDEAHKGSPPDLNLALVQKDGGLVDVARYTPYGFSGPLSQGNIAGITGTLLPQISGAQAALRGQDPFGRPLKLQPTADNPKGTPSGWDKLGVAVNAGLEASVPWLAMARRLQEGGGTPFGNSTVLSPKTKPGSSHMSAIRRTFDPTRPTYVKPPASSGTPWSRPRRRGGSSGGFKYGGTSKTQGGFKYGGGG